MGAVARGPAGFGSPIRVELAMTASVDVLESKFEWVRQKAGSLSSVIEFLSECVDAGAAGLPFVQRLFVDDYGGFTYKHEFKGVAAATLLAWGESGLDAMIEAANRTGRVNDVGHAVRILAAVAAGASIGGLNRIADPDLEAKVNARRADAPRLADAARSKLVALVLSYQDEDELLFHVGGSMGKLGGATPAIAVEIFRALASRWLATSLPVIEEYEELIRTDSTHEPSFQAFLTKHPQLLDPMAIQVWPEPDLFGKKRPDFIVRRSDDSYLAIEIECPAKMLMTKLGNLSSKASHAERQATDYRTYLTQNFKEAQQHFPGFQEPDCLAVCGLEGALSSKQMLALRELHHSKHRTRIVGFDWLAWRARAVVDNMIRSPIAVTKAKIR